MRILLVLILLFVLPFKQLSAADAPSGVVVQQSDFESKKNFFCGDNNEKSDSDKCKKFMATELGDSNPTKACDDAYKDYSKDLKEAKKEYDKKIEKAKEDLVKEEKDYNEKMTKYKKDMADLQTKLNKIQPELQQKVAKIDQEASDLNLKGDKDQKIAVEEMGENSDKMISDMNVSVPQIYSEYQQDVDQALRSCKADAQKDALTRLNMATVQAQARNKGQIRFTSVGSFGEKDADKIKRIVLANYNDCVSITTKRAQQKRDMALQQKKNEVDSLQRKIQSQGDAIQKSAANLQQQVQTLQSQKQSLSANAQSELQSLSTQLQAMSQEASNYQQIQQQKIDDLQNKANGRDLKDASDKKAKAKVLKDKADIEDWASYTTSKDVVFGKCCCFSDDNSATKGCENSVDGNDKIKSVVSDYSIRQDICGNPPDKSSKDRDRSSRH